jgi:hypothetical protein
MEFESTEKKKAPQSRVCVVYDPHDGRIIHGHEFVGDGTGVFGPEGREEREQQTLEGARRNHGDVSLLRIFHVPTDVPLRPERRLARHQVGTLGRALQMAA